MYGQDILRGISKVPFEIPHKISCPYIERYVFYTEVKFHGKELLSVFEMVPLGDTASLQGQLNHTHATAAAQWPACSTQAQ